MENNTRKNHHYVSQSYLKAWANNHHKIWTYRTLVSHNLVPHWSEVSTKSAAKQQHLFTRSFSVKDSDEIEIWMDQEIETPAQTALSKIRSCKMLSTQEWDYLLRFIALHDIRSPMYFIDNLNRWKSGMPDVIEEALQHAVKKIEANIEKEQLSTHKVNSDANLIPIKVSKEINDDSEFGFLKAEVLLGRGLWLFAIRHILSKTYKVLNNHNWSIIESPEGIEWITSDNPVVKLNYYSQGSYDFKGGWGNDGSEILFPLSPNLLLYTQVGNKININNSSKEMATTLNRIIAENAHRYIFSSRPVEELKNIVPRIVNSEAYRNEQEAWENWHVNHKKLEEKYQKSNYVNEQQT